MTKQLAPPILGMVSSGSILTMKSTASISPKDTTVEKVSNGREFVYWGDNNDLPTKVLGEIGQNEILFRANEFNKSIHVGNGLIYYQEIIEKNVRHIELIQDNEIDDWLEENNSDLLWKNFVENYETLGNLIPELITNQSRDYIARMFCKDSAWCRWGLQNKSTFEVDKLHYNADWQNYKDADTAKIDVLNSKFPLQDLLSRKSGYNFIFRIPPVANNRFYYDTCNTEVLINAGTLEISADIKKTLKSLLKNQATVVWHIEVAEIYFISKYGDADWNKRKNDPKKREEAMKALQTTIDTYLSGAENAGKTLITGCMYDKQGKKISGVTITPLANAMQKGAWIPDQQQCANDIYQGMGVDPSSVGGFGNQNRTMNSGSEKESSFWNSNATLFTERMMTLMPFYFVARVNGWTKRHKRFRWGVMDMDMSVVKSPEGNNPTNTP